MAPYRTDERTQTAEAPRDPGIVGDVIAQFADPLAFYRELIQNSIDAGSPSIEVRLEHVDTTLRVSVRDRGEGMTRDTLENQLLVLFRSTKENDNTKIGKFGIGFASVLAPNPEVVIVHSTREGRRLTLHLHRDLTYQLFDAGPASQVGTTVELELAATVPQAHDLVGRSRVALVRWCRHASVSIQLEIEVPGLERTVERIDRPLGLEGALIEVRGTSPDGRLTAVVGLRREAAAYVGFFNHGLMLHETVEPLAGNVACKLQDSRLGHTLSRDNVRRDEHFDRAIELARSLAARELPRDAGLAMRAAAEAGDYSAYRTLALALADARIALKPDVWWVPLVDPIDKQRAMPVESIGRRAWVADEPSQLSGMLAANGIPILRMLPSDQPWMGAQLRSMGIEVTGIGTAFVRVATVDLSASDHALLATLDGHLDACRRRPEGIAIARLEGSLAFQLAVSGGPDDARYTDSRGAYVLDHDTARRTPFPVLGRRHLVLNEGHPMIRAVRAADDPRTAAAHLARALLLEYELLDQRRSEILLDRALTELGGT
ncbi:MAG: ATP-binding protein [Deltaproteobacteria bacterium]|nr:ATP-binding protein [Deltaproteobacteria bacterium]